MSDLEATRAAQRELYGEPLGDIIDRCRGILGLNQAKVATLLGVSAPMLSQVMNGHRIKIGNPTAVHRLRLMVELSDQVGAGVLDASAAIARIEESNPSDVLTGTTQRVSLSTVAELVQASFRRAGGAQDYLEIAAAVEERHPEVARLLRGFGAGRIDDAVALLQ